MGRRRPAVPPRQGIQSIPCKEARSAYHVEQTNESYDRRRVCLSRSHEERSGLTRRGRTIATSAW
eukprot:scaffold2852_cov303-Pavlova_lutheri.AAC.2